MIHPVNQIAGCCTENRYWRWQVQWLVGKECAQENQPSDVVRPPRSQRRLNWKMPAVDQCSHCQKRRDSLTERNSARALWDSSWNVRGHHVNSAAKLLYMFSNPTKAKESPGFKKPGYLHQPGKEKQQEAVWNERKEKGKKKHMRKRSEKRVKKSEK